MSDGMSGFCDHCDMPRASCVHGMSKAEQAEEERKARKFRIGSEPLYADGPTISATQSSRCVGCGYAIEPDDSITHVEEGWAHTSEVQRSTNPVNVVDFDGF